MPWLASVGLSVTRTWDVPMQDRDRGRRGAGTAQALRYCNFHGRMAGRLEVYSTGARDSCWCLLSSGLVSVTQRGL